MSCVSCMSLCVFVAACEGLCRFVMIYASIDGPI